MASSGCGTLDVIFLNVARQDDPRGSFAQLMRLEFAFMNEAKHARRTDRQCCRRFIKCHLPACETFSVPVDGYCVSAPQATHERLRPAITAPCRFARAVEQ